MDLGLISGTKRKRSRPCKASEMYSPSVLFSEAYSHALRKAGVIGILSAKYGFLLPDDVIEPYDLTLNKMDKRSRVEWSEKVLRQMKKRIDLDKIDSVYLHTGERYREYLKPKLEKMGKKCIVPLKGMGYGQQLAWYYKTRG